MIDAGTVLSAVGVSKSYGSTAALRDVSLDLRSGEVHCLVGENGAGKSTLVKVLTGLVAPDKGQVFIDGYGLDSATIAQRRDSGVAAVYQHPGTFPELSVLENIFAGMQPLKKNWPGFRIDRSLMESEARRVLDAVGSSAAPSTPMSNLSVGDRQLVEMAKALLGNAKVLILDEPTAALSSAEADDLFSLVNQLRSRSIAVLLITHRLDEVFRIADQVSVLRDGALIATRNAADSSKEWLVDTMVGRHVEPRSRTRLSSRGDIAIEVRSWRREPDAPEVDLQIHAGEIVGLAGLVGAGRTELAHSIVGLTTKATGDLLVNGVFVPSRQRTPVTMMRRGVVYVSEDRQTSGLTLDRSVKQNISLPAIRQLRTRTGGINRRAEKAWSARWAQQLDIRPRSSAVLAGALSGGNQQKVLLARWLATDPCVLLLDEPTAGVDVGAQAQIHELIRELAHGGVAVLLISSDLPEIFELADRVVVMAQSRISGHFATSQTTPEAVMHAATDFSLPERAPL